jgi:hypothetical protein
MSRVLIACAALTFAPPAFAEEKPTVAGAVTLDGKPIEGASIGFHLADPAKPPVVATTDKAGTYKVALPAGEYTVTVVKAIVVPKSNPPRETLVTPGKYASPKTSGLKVTVKDGANTFDVGLKK